MSVYGYVPLLPDKKLVLTRNKIYVYALEHNLLPIVFVEEKEPVENEWGDRTLGSLIYDNCVRGDILIIPQFSCLLHRRSSLDEIIKAIQVCGITLHVTCNSVIIPHLIFNQEFSQDYRHVPHARQPDTYTSRLDGNEATIKVLLEMGVSTNTLAQEYGMSISGFTKWLKKKGLR